ncbi:MAG: class I tRNA ligase family protein, partial [Muribaculaceae bacterium]|nr:class I tRNA ligase family protein [Muribaculaceae bacterium]
FRLVKGWNVDETAHVDEATAQAIEWFDGKLSESAAEVADLLSKFRLSEAVNLLYRLFWDEFSSWYLEIVKPAYGGAVSKTAYEATLRYFDTLLRLLHPFMPFITEELWQNLAERRQGESIMYAPVPEAKGSDALLMAEMECAKEIITAVRGVRAKRNIAPKESLVLNAVGDGLPAPGFKAIIVKLANLSAFTDNAEKDPAAASFLIGTREYLVPLASSIDTEAEKAKLAKDIEYYEGFLASVEKKLSNERFVSKAPAAVVEAEKRKQADAESKLSTLRAALAALS